MTQGVININITLYPKIDLHVHLDGCISYETIKKISEHDNIKLPAYDKNELNKLLKADTSTKDMTSYLSKFELPLLCLQTSYALELAAFNLMRQAYSNNIKYMEVRFAPLLHIKRGLKGSEVVESVLRGLERGERLFGIISRAILICMRHHSINNNMYIVKLAKRFCGNGVVGIDLAGDETNFPPDLFVEVFDYAHESGIPITIHAGETAGPKNIWTAINKLHARRIGHGISAIKDLDLLRYLSIHKTTLELCPTSNLQTNAVENLRDYPAKRFFDEKIPISINTDNTAASDTSLTSEYATIVNKCGLSLNNMEAVLLQSLEAAFISTNEKIKIYESIRLDLNDFWESYPDYKPNNYQCVFSK